MELKNKKIILTDDELNKLIVYKLRVFDDAITYHYSAIRKEEFDTEKFKTLGQKQLDEYNKATFDPNAPDEKAEDTNDIGFIKYQLNKLFSDYLEWLGKRPNTKIPTKELINKIKKEHYQLFQLTTQDKDTQLSNQILYFLQQLLESDDYVDKRTAQIQGKHYLPKPTPLLGTLINASKIQKQMEYAETLMTKTPWMDVFNDMIRPTKNVGIISKTTLDEKRQCLSFIMELMGKEYVEDIKYEDCKEINKLIYKVPKNIHKKNPNVKLLDALLPDEDDRERGLSVSSIYKYLTIFKEFLKYCRKQRLLIEDLADIIDTPKNFKGKNTYMPFSEDDLKKIFNPRNYCSYCKNGKDAPKFFVPLISLFSAARLNEICQIRVEDIKEEDGITYIQTEDKHTLQSLKNIQSKRRIPIHPKLKEMGFITYIKKMKEKGEEWLFPTLLKQYNPKHKLGKNVSRSFSSYLKKLEIKEKTLVFHSFRHTVRPKLRDECHLQQEYIDALCGWEAIGNAGAKNYAHKDIIPIKSLFNAISKLKYPYLNDSLKEIKERIKRSKIKIP